MNRLFTIKRNQYFLALVVVLAASLSCNLPFLGESGNNSEENLAESIAASGLVYVDQIEAGEDELIIEYQVFLEDSPEMIVSGWLTVLVAAHEAFPDVGQYILLTIMNGGPYLEITAQGIDLDGFMKEELTPDEFLARLEIIDKRPADDRARVLLAETGLDIDRVNLNGGILTISYWPEPAEDQAALMEEWWSIFDALAVVEDKVEVIEIQSLMLDGSMISVSEEVARLKDYRIGEVTALEFLAGLEVVIEEFVE